jgi:capsular polysaccharide biosynthesis protein
MGGHHRPAGSQVTSHKLRSAQTRSGVKWLPRRPISMELRQYFAILRRRVVLVIVTMAVAGAVAWVSTPRSPRYVAKTTIYVGLRQFSINANQNTVSNDVLQGVERLVATYAQMIQSQPIAQAALERTHVPRSAAAVVGESQASPVAGTQLLLVAVTDRDPRVAADLANGLSDSFAEAVQAFEPSTPATEGSVPSLPAYVFDKAKLPTSPESTGAARNVVLGLVFGFLLAAGISFLLEYLDVTIKNPVDAERRLELPVLGVVPMYRQGRVGPPSAA